MALLVLLAAAAGAGVVAAHARDVCASGDGRVYAGWLPESDANSVGAEFPCVVFRQVSLAPDVQTHDGTNGWERPRFAFDCWGAADESASAYANAHAIADAVKPLIRAASFRIGKTISAAAPAARKRRGPFFVSGTDRGSGIKSPKYAETLLYRKGGIMI